MHHPDPELECVARALDGHGLSVDLDGARVRLHEAVDDVHERRLAGSVLTEQPVDLPVCDVEGDGVVRGRLAEALGDPA